MLARPRVGVPPSSEPARPSARPRYRRRSRRGHSRRAGAGTAVGAARLTSALRVEVSPFLARTQRSRGPSTQPIVVDRLSRASVLWAVAQVGTVWACSLSPPRAATCSIVLSEAKLSSSCARRRGTTRRSIRRARPGRRLADAPTRRLAARPQPTDAKHARTALQTPRRRRRRTARSTTDDATSTPTTHGEKRRTHRR